MNKITRLIQSFIDDILRFGTVKATSPFAVRFTGESDNHACKYLSSYTPVVDDYVVLLKHRGTYICLGKIL